MSVIYTLQRKAEIVSLYKKAIPNYMFKFLKLRTLKERVVLVTEFVRGKYLYQSIFLTIETSE